MKLITSRTRRTLRRFGASLCVGLAASLSVLSAPASADGVASAASAQASATAPVASGPAAGTISGTVIDGTTKAPLAGVCLTISGTSASGYANDTATTGAGGSFSFSGESADSYAVDVDPTCGGTITSSYAGASLPNRVGLTPTAGVSGLAISLSVGATVSGRVVASVGGAAIAGACITVNGGYGSPSWDYHATTTGADGRYAVTGVSANAEEFVIVDPSCDGTRSSPFLGVYETITTIAGQTTTQDFSLQRGGSLAGTVRTSAGVPVAGVCIQLSPVFDTSGISMPSLYASTDSSGGYQFPLLPTGTYSASVDPSCQSTPLGPTTLFNLVVAASSTTTADATLAPAGLITGTITDHSGAGESFCRVTATSSTPGTSSGGWTQDDGTYSIMVAAGTYSLVVECYSAVPGYTMAIGTATVIAGQTTSGHDAVWSPPTTGSIAGTVRAASTGAPVGGVCVTAMTLWPQTTAGSTTTAADGSYTLANLPPSTYVIKFDPTCGGTASSSLVVTYAPDWVTVHAGDALTANDASLASGAGISGTVTSRTTGTGIGGVCVTASTSSYPSVSVSSVTAADGTYSMVGLQAGFVSVLADPSCAGTVQSPYSAAYHLDGSDQYFSVTAGSTNTRIDVSLVGVGSIAGTVVGSDTSAALAAVCVSAYALDPGVPSPADTASATDGSFSFARLAPGRYTVTIDPSCGGSKTSTYQPSAGWTSLVVTEGATSRTTIVAIKDGGLSGTVTVGGTGRAGVCVYGWQGPFQGQGPLVATTDARGSWTSSAVAPGYYWLIADPTCRGNVTSSLAATSTLAPVAVTSAHMTSGTVFSLVGSGSLSGTITDAVTSSAVESSCYGWANPSSDPSLTDVSFSVDPSGSFSVSGLAPGMWELSLHCGGYPNGFSRLVRIAAGATTSVVASIAPGATISGMVTTGGKPLAGACVSASDPSIGISVNTAVARSDGTFTLTGLAAGSYQIEASSGSGSFCQVQPGGGFGVGISASVTVGAGSTITGVAVAVPASGAIAGVISSSQGGVSGQCVSAIPMAGTLLRFGEAMSSPTSSDGAYSIQDLNPGSYRLAVAACQGTTSTFAAAVGAPVIVTSGTTTSGADFALVTGGVITGKVTLPSGWPSGAPACVRATSATTQAVSEATGGWSFNQAMTGADGSYAITGLPPSTYTLGFNCVGDVLRGDGGPAADGGGSTTATVTSGATTTVPTLSGLTAPISLSGRVTGSGGAGVPGACVEVYGGQGVTGQGNATTAVDGSWSISGLSAGTYSVMVLPTCQGRSPYASTTIVAAARVTAGKSATIAVSLVAGGGITGTIAAGSPATGVAGVCVTPTSADGVVGATSVTGTDGTYSLAGLAAGSWRVVADPTCAGSSTSTLAAAMTTVVVKASKIAKAGTVALSGFGSVSGKVTQSGGTGIGGVCVTLTPTVAAFGTVTATTTGNGTYLASGLDPGTYAVKIAPGCGTVHTDDVPQRLTGTVVVTAGATTSGVNATLVEGGSVAGRLLGALAGHGVLDVTAFDATGAAVATTTSSSDGTYRLIGVPAGTYVIGTGGDYSAAAAVHAGPVVVAAGGSVTGIDITLGSPGSQLTGTVIDGLTGRSLSGACISARPSSGGPALARTTASQSYQTAYYSAVYTEPFDYTLTGLTAGSYTVTVDPSCGGTIATTLAPTTLGTPVVVSGFGSGYLPTVVLALAVAPKFTSPARATFVHGVSGSFQVSSTGNPPATYSESGALPAGVTFTARGLLKGTAAAKGKTTITITATNSAGSVTKSFTLKVT